MKNIRCCFVKKTRVTSRGKLMMCGFRCTCILPWDHFLNDVSLIVCYRFEDNARHALPPETNYTAGCMFSRPTTFTSISLLRLPIERCPLFPLSNPSDARATFFGEWPSSILYGCSVHRIRLFTNPPVRLYSVTKSPPSGHPSCSDQILLLLSLVPLLLRFRQWYCFQPMPAYASTGHLSTVILNLIVTLV